MSEDFDQHHKWVFDKRRRKLDRAEQACLELISALRDELRQGTPEGNMGARPLELTRQIMRCIHDGFDDVDMKEQEHRLYFAEREIEED
jgi:hypothetical protein